MENTKAIEPTRLPRWALYKKLRRTIERDLMDKGAPHDASAVDRYLEDNMVAIAVDLVELLRLDASLRSAVSTH